MTYRSDINHALYNRRSCEDRLLQIVLRQYFERVSNTDH